MRRQCQMNTFSNYEWQRCVSFSWKSKVINVFSKTCSEIAYTWPINSNKEEIVLSCDNKELIVQRFMKVFDQNWMYVEARNQRTAPQQTLLYRGRTVRSSHRRCFIRKLFLKTLQYPQEKHLCWSLFLKMLQTFRPATLLEKDPNTGVFLQILQNF